MVDERGDEGTVRIIQVSDSLDWPTATTTTTVSKEEPSDTFAITIQCAGYGYFEYQEGVATFENDTFLLESTREDQDDENDDDEDDNEDDDMEDTAPEIDLFSLSEAELEQLNHYQVLHLKYRANLTPDDVKKAYRKACLKYHPDKSGQQAQDEDEDPVFLKVKTAFDVLSTQKIAYDSTELPFDESLPDPNPMDFYQEYGPVFERNLHFDARLLANGNNNNNSNSRRRKSRNTSNTKKMEPPKFGDDSTSIEDVHAFYDYWTHFSSWRDFTIQAAKELESSQEGLENAESRFEKRFYQKEIDKRAKKLKQMEQARITTLVERAMSADPRLLQERKRQLEEKEQRQRQREQQALEKKRQEEEERENQIRLEQEEKERKAREKLQREKEKKQLRKVKQVFRRHISDALQSTKQPEHHMEDEVDFICTTLEREDLVSLNQKLASLKNSPAQVLTTLSQKVEQIKNSTSQEPETKEVPNEPSNPEPKPSDSNNTENSSSKKKTPFSKEELSALSKAIKKFPPGGANRWDQIASYINNVCRPDDPRTKEECIEAFNQNAIRPGRTGNNTSNNSKAATSANANDKTVEPPPSETTTPKQPQVAANTTTATATADGDGWTEEQDRQLQAGLAQFPASMDKNERWTNIAKGVDGKTKKQCVQRFKVIRDALKNKK